MQGELPLGDIVKLPKGRPTAISHFCRKIRFSRGNKCENCGATSDQRQIEGHHILAYHEHPSLGKDERNILVLCQRCHKGLSKPHGDLYGDRLMHLAMLRRELRERIASYVEEKAPKLTTFIRIVRAGEEAAKDYFFRRLN